MDRSNISSRQAVALAALFTMGSSVVLWVEHGAGSDAWIALLAAALAAVPFCLMYARISTLYPDRDLFDAARAALGGFFGNAAALIFMLYAILLGAFTLRCLGEYIQITALKNTPQLFIVLVFGGLAAYMARGGASVMGRSAVVLFGLTALIFVISFLALIKDMEAANLLPVFSEGLKPVVNEGVQMLAYPFAECVLVLSFIGRAEQGKSKYAIILYGLALSALLLLTNLLRDILILGGETFLSLYFPSNLSISLINVGNMGMRLESVAAFAFIACVLARVAVCVYASCAGAAQLFALEKRAPLAFPMVLLMAILSVLMFNSTSQVSGWGGGAYTWLALPIQIAIPFVIWLAAEIRNLRYRHVRK